MSREKFLFDHAYNAVYVHIDKFSYDADGEYQYCGKLNGRTESEFIRDYETEEPGHWTRGATFED